MLLVPVLCDSTKIAQTLMSLVHLISHDKQNTHLPRHNKCALTDLGSASVNKEYLNHFVTVCFFMLTFALI